MTSKGQDQAALQETHKLNTAGRKEEGSGRNESRPEIGAESAKHEFDLYRKKGLQKVPFSNTIKSIIVFKERMNQWTWSRLKNTA
jgi:hypothetical protein